MRNPKFLLVLLLAFYQLILVGCSVDSTMPTIPEPTPKPATAEQQLDRLYRLAQSAPSPESEGYRLQAAKILLTLNRADEAEKIYEDIPTDKLTDNMRANYAMIGAQLAINHYDGQTALNLLSENAGILSRSANETLIQIAKLKAQAFQFVDMPMEGAEQLIQISPLLSGMSATENKEMLWQLLMQSTTEDIKNKQLVSGGDHHLSGWLQLALISKNNQDDLEHQLLKLNQWLAQWQSHPGASDLPNELKLLSTIVTERPSHITLMLPLRGPNGVAGKAIRDGFLSAYYRAYSQTSQTPKISIIDTGESENFQALYDNAIAAGSELIIGPLQKKNVQIVMQQPELKVPTLALNYVESNTNQTNLYQFGLSAEDEARQVARKAWQEGYRNSLVLMPDSSWGKRIATAFEMEWLTLSGTLLETQFFSNEKNYSNAIQQLLNIDESKRRAQRLQSLTRTKIEFTARRREDVDFIFIAATPKQARQIKPTLAFHFAGKIPVYATSHVFSGSSDPLLDRDLDNVIFCETPWMLDDSNNPLKNQINQIWPATASRLGRLYAMGIDAYRLFPRIKQLSVISNSKLDGMTGSLSLDPYGRILRTLNWAQFKGGKVTRLN